MRFLIVLLFYFLTNITAFAQTTNHPKDFSTKAVEQAKSECLTELFTQCLITLSLDAAFTSPQHSSRLVSKIATARVKLGDMQGGRETISLLEEPTEDFLLASGRWDEAEKLIRDKFKNLIVEMGSPEGSLTNRMVRAQLALRAVEEALLTARKTKGTNLERSSALSQVVYYLVEKGSISRALQITQEIGEMRSGAYTVAEIISRLATDGRIEEAIIALQYIPSSDTPTLPELRAYIAIARAQVAVGDIEAARIILGKLPSVKLAAKRNIEPYLDVMDLFIQIGDNPAAQILGKMALDIARPNFIPNAASERLAQVALYLTLAGALNEGQNTFEVAASLLSGNNRQATRAKLILHLYRSLAEGGTSAIADFDKVIAILRNERIGAREIQNLHVLLETRNFDKAAAVVKALDANYHAYFYTGRLLQPLVELHLSEGRTDVAEEMIQTLRTWHVKSDAVISIAERVSVMKARQMLIELADWSVSVRPRTRYETDADIVSLLSKVGQEQIRFGFADDGNTTLKTAFEMIEKLKPWEQVDAYLRIAEILNGSR